jgi:uncharacterized membrane protein
VEIPQSQFEQLLEQVRGLTARVHRLETLLRVSPPAPAPPTSVPIEEEVPAQPVRSRELTQPAPPPPKFAIPSKVVERSDLEARIGSHWLNRIGIAAVLIGVSYFLKYAFDSGWIGPAGRIAIGLIAGIGVVLWSERFRTRDYRVFSYSLKAVGIGVLYLSLWAAFQVYQLIPSGAAFFCMLAVTASTCALAITQDAEILAVFAITGGFSTPVLLSTGVNHEVVLFSYITVLDVGILALVAFKPWRRLLWLGFTGTLALYVGWAVEYYTRNEIEPTLIFATLFFIVFAIAPLFMLRQEKGGGVMPLAFAFVNAATYFLQAYAMITEISNAAMAWFSLALAAVYIGLNQIRPRTPDKAAEANLRLMHLALAVGLITVAIPIRLEAHWITIGWFVESAVLLWLGKRIKADLLNAFALTALLLGVGRLLIYDNFQNTAVILNMRMLVYAVAIAVLGLIAYYATKRQDDLANNIGRAAAVALNILALRALTLEVEDYYSRQMHTVAAGNWRLTNWTEIRIARDFTYSALWMGYGAVLMIIGFWRRSAFIRWQALTLIAITTVKVFVWDTHELDRIYRILSFVVLGVLLLAVSFAYQRDWLKLAPRKNSAAGDSTGA